MRRECLDRRLRILVWAVVLTVMLATALVGSAVVYLSTRPCQIDLVSRTRSPDGLRDAVSYRAACGGATMPFAIHIAVLRAGDPPREKGLVFSALATPVETKWNGPHRLSIAYPSSAQIYWRKAKMNGVSVGYSPRAAGWRDSLGLVESNRYADFGNFHYGATGAAAGFSPGLLQRYAGAEQYFSANANPEFGAPWGGPPYGDDPRDNQFIKSGIAYDQRGKATGR